MPSPLSPFSWSWPLAITSLSATSLLPFQDFIYIESQSMRCFVLSFLAQHTAFEDHLCCGTHLSPSLCFAEQCSIARMHYVCLSSSPGDEHVSHCKFSAVTDTIKKNIDRQAFVWASFSISLR